MAIFNSYVSLPASIQQFPLAAGKAPTKPPLVVSGFDLTSKQWDTIFETSESRIIAGQLMGILPSIFDI